MTASTTTEMIDVPCDTVHEIIGTAIHAKFRGHTDINIDPILAEILDNLDHGHTDTQTYRLPVGTAFRLLHFSYMDALQVYDLDECAEDTYQHPAVLAEIQLQEQLIKEAPEAYERLSAQWHAECDRQLAEFKAAELA